MTMSIPERIEAEFLQAQQAQRQGRDAQAQASWKVILGLNPAHLPTLQAMGQHALLRRDLAGARHCFEQLTQLDAANAQHWIHLAMLFRAAADAGRE